MVPRKDAIGLETRLALLWTVVGPPEAQFDRYVNLANHLSGRPFFAGEGELFVDCFRHPREVCDMILHRAKEMDNELYI
jgi:hypothetical protein